jgi:hypothetical protein
MALHKRAKKMTLMLAVNDHNEWHGNRQTKKAKKKSAY